MNSQLIPVALHTRTIKINELNCMRFNISENELRFGTEVVSCVNKTLSYENEQLKRVTKTFIPLQELELKVQERLKRSNARNEDYFKDFLVLELLEWFKTRFFRWVDVPSCNVCSKRMKNIGYAAPSPDDLKYDAVKVELFTCVTCKLEKRFPRYNHPGKLLLTREGRCGEWANCFSLILRSLDYDIRFVNDWKDHVWVEVYSDLQKRWLHCDPCENICDKPLTYEKGWGKIYSYVIAFSKDEIQDVTWRYTLKFKDAIDRRNLVRETWLLNLIDNVSTLLQRYLDSSKKQLLLERRVTELVSFLTPPSESNNSGEGEEFSGRTSGSLEWRLARGEISTPGTTSSTPFIFTPTKSEISSKEIHISYTPVTDKYTRISDPNHEVNGVVGWQKCVFQAKSIARKIEQDWKMAYLARVESSSNSGLLSWKFETGQTHLVFDRLSCVCQSATFESGKVLWKISNGNKDISYPSGSNMLNIREFSGSTCIILTAELSGGDGKNAWQHAQIFRTALESPTHPFVTRITLKESETK